MNEEYHTGQGLTMADLGLSLDELAGQPLEVLACEGAKVMLTVALEEEVTLLSCNVAAMSVARAVTMATAMVIASAGWALVPER